MTPACRTTPSSRIRASASARTSSRPGIPRSQAAYSATESAGVRIGAQPSCLRASMSEQMCRVSPNRYSPVIRAARSEP